MFWIVFLISFLIVFVISFSSDDLKGQKGRFIVSLFQGLFYGGGLAYMILQVLLILKVVSNIF